LSRKARPERHLVGITGPPGVGKSSLTTQLIREYRSRGKTVGIIAVDPSSKRSGGALLGDRSRIYHDIDDEGVFIRSMASGLHMGGLAWRTRHCLTVFEAVYDIIIIETVGVGQSETEVSQVADTVAFIFQPGSGDILQFMKAGIMEIPHVLVVNKADQKPLAAKTASDLTVTKDYSESELKGWELKVVMTSALEAWGQNELVDVLESHRRFLDEMGIVEELRYRNRVDWVSMLFKERFGEFGIEVLGGEERVRNILVQADINNPMKRLQALANKMIQNIQERGKSQLIEGL
jgi:LAO/AO transport system kinase